MTQVDVWILSGITLLVGFLLRHYLGPELKKVEASIPAADLSILQQLASFVVPLVERTLPLAAGAEKMNQAIDLVLGWLRARGISLSLTEIQGAIEKAYADFVSSGQKSVYVTKPSPKSPAPVVSPKTSPKTSPTTTTQTS